jgi:hypothetical protein
VEDKQDVNAWADALLDQHRSAPPPAADPASTDDLPRGMRFLLRLGGGPPPDPEMIERLRRASRRQAYFANLEAVFTIIGVLGLLAFAFIATSQF